MQIDFLKLFQRLTKKELERNCPINILQGTPLDLIDFPSKSLYNGLIVLRFVHLVNLMTLAKNVKSIEYSDLD